jgi:hypothetical protein
MFCVLVESLHSVICFTVHPTYASEDPWSWNEARTALGSHLVSSPLFSKCGKQTLSLPKLKLHGRRLYCFILSAMIFTASSLLSALQLNGIVNYFAGSSLPQIHLGLTLPLRENGGIALIQRDAFLDSLVYNMTVPELG